jgi:nitrate reductase molybdenum cofactor assembly chaperone NarJ/NarW
MLKDSTSRLFGLFADLLEYPSFVTPLKAGLCYEQLHGSQTRASSLLENFYRDMEKQTLEKMQEIYTSTFDMQPVCYPYIGYQLFGESYKRGAFMAQLNEAYRASGYSVEKELPDHISVVLRFLGTAAARREDDFGRALLCEGLVPALKKMVDVLEKKDSNPYMDVVSALLLVLREPAEKEVDHA